MNKGITRPVWVEINLDNLEFNIKQIKKNVSQETLLMAVVKADAYGHGIIPVARACVRAGADRLAVAIPEEGAALSRTGIGVPIQVLGEVLPAQIPLIIEHDLIATISRKQTAEELNRLAGKAGKIIRVHIMIDTGMGRIGVYPEQALDFIEEIADYSRLKIEGLTTHFARADEGDKDYTYYQWERFKGIIAGLEKKGYKIPIKHVANSATVIDLPEMQLDMVRPGIVIYGMRPSDQVNPNFPLKPVLSWKGRIVYLKEVPPGTGISYGTTFTTSQKARIATIPLGYADGYSRRLSNRGEVLIRGQRAPVRGRVCMDQIMVDVSEIKGVNTGDEVVLIGQQGQQEIKASELAKLMGTINYEVTSIISKRVPRVYQNT